MKATTLLERQNRNLQHLCEAVARGSASVRQSLLPQLAGDLAAHFAVEDRLFYAAVGKTLGEEAWGAEGRARHDQAMDALDRILEAALDGVEFDRAMTELQLVIELHAQEEEEGLFPRLERTLEADASRALASAMMALYHAEVEAGYSPLRNASTRSPACDPSLDDGHLGVP